MNLPSTKNNLQTSTNITKPEKAHENNNLTRFGLNAYVLGAMKERFNCFGKSITILAAPLISRELQFS